MEWISIQRRIRTMMYDCCQMLMGNVSKQASIFCNNCIGAFVAHDFKLPFNSPTVNLMIPPADFITYIENMDKYKNATIEQTVSNKEWPVALLGGNIELNFIHYNSVELGREAWQRRSARINPNELYFILVETDGCTYADLKRFNNLPYKNKVALTHKPYPDIKCAYYIKGYENEKGVIDSYRFHKFLPLRIYDQFNWMKFLKSRK